MTTPADASERAIRDWLAALLEAIDLPHGATVGDDEADYLRARLADLPPLTYQTWNAAPSEEGSQR
jgi:hypothetical protein